MFKIPFPLRAPAGTDDAASPPPDPGLGDAHEDAAWAEPAPQEPAATDAKPAEEAAPTSAEDAVRAALEKKAPEDVGGKKEPEKAAEATQESAAPTTEAAQPSRSQLDELCQIPRGLNGEARAKFKALSDHARQLDSQFQQRSQEYEQTSQRLRGFEEVLRDAGATAPVLNSHLQYIRAINTGDYESALAFIEAERAGLAQAMGKPLEGVDLLADFPDLREAVDNYQMTENAALEMAKLRRGATQQQARDQQEQQAEQQRQAQQQYTQRRAAAMQGVEAWIESQKSSIDWDVMEGAVVEFLKQPATRQTLSNTPPEQWLDIIKSHYASIQTLVARNAPQRNGPTPLRPRGAGGAVGAQASSSEDAVRQRLGY